MFPHVLPTVGGANNIPHVPTVGGGAHVPPFNMLSTFAGRVLECDWPLLVRASSLGGEIEELLHSNQPPSLHLEQLVHGETRVRQCLRHRGTTVA